MTPRTPDRRSYIGDPLPPADAPEHRLERPAVFTNEARLAAIEARLTDLERTLDAIAARLGIPVD